MAYIINKKAGFTLVELIVIIVIIGLLAAMALPKLGVLTDEERKVINALQTSTQQSRNECRTSANGAGKNGDTFCGGTAASDNYGGNSS
ncbi:MAG: prepilin-type N-terminal cleavage/methylation domain-containing protein [Magnetococcus sp. YQC-5]